MPSKKEQPYAYFYASIENDGFTLLTLLRGKALNHEPNWLRLVIPQNYFNLNKSTVEALVSAVDFEAALKIVLDSYYAKFFVKAQNPEETIANAGKAFKKAVFQHAKSSAISETFNIGSPLAFMTQKEAEVFNLTVLSLGVDSAMKPDEHSKPTFTLNLFIFNYFAFSFRLSTTSVWMNFCLNGLNSVPVP